MLIDQEGGRVARLSPPHWPALPPARAIGLLAERDRGAGVEAARSSGRIIGVMLNDLDIDVACAPVADLLLPETHGVIGDRAYSDDPALVSALAEAVCDGLADAGVTPIVKHIPGHGRATADSHLALPRIAASRDELERADFVTFQGAPATAWAMVAHCVYTAFDKDRPASISPTVISEAIRGSIGFEGLLIADDISMKALSGSLADNAAATLAAGCDLTLHCSGDLAEMRQIAPVVSQLSDAAAERLERSGAKVRAAKMQIDATAERAWLNSWAPL